MKDVSPYSTGVVPLEIEIPKEVVTHYSKIGIYTKLPSYEHIEGKNSLGVDDAYNAYGFIEPETFPLKYKDKESEKRAEDRARILFARLYESKVRDIKIKSRDYMTHARTLPIKIVGDVEGIEKTLYVKKPSLARIFGNALYNIISGNEENIFVFNKTVFVENSISGGMIRDDSKVKITRNKDFFKQAIRADIHDWYLSINDLDNYRNFLVGQDYKVKLIDFDCLFFRRDDEESLLEFLVKDNSIKLSEDDKDEMEWIRKDEKSKIKKRIVRSNTYGKIINLMNKIPEINELVKRQYPFIRDIKGYFKMRESELE